MRLASLLSTLHLPRLSLLRLLGGPLSASIHFARVLLLSSLLHLLTLPSAILSLWSPVKLWTPTLTLLSSGLSLRLPGLDLWCLLSNLPTAILSLLALHLRPIRSSLASSTVLAAVSPAAALAEEIDVCAEDGQQGARRCDGRNPFKITSSHTSPLIEDT